ncbi:hypothetical protein [Roseibium aggregatum]|uniref:YARHG domain-containing protein n=1 Tax=Roseibium aggregatum TaxID=187304 RepID=A0A939EB19_9HYPH|nr:hypothetical protein [Roseibium aggregatum]MBN9668783.1 hypothetical protein [Roseibium aggregatum]
MEQTSQSIRPAMRRLAITLLSGSAVIAAVTLPSHAQSGRPDTRKMTCAQVQSTIKQRGAAVLATGQYTFDRYVADRSFCERGQILRNDYVPSRDNAKCFVQRCGHRPSFNNN